MRRQLETVRIAKEHLDLALEQCFQAERYSNMKDKLIRSRSNRPMQLFRYMLTLGKRCRYGRARGAAHHLNVGGGESRNMPFRFPGLAV